MCTLQTSSKYYLINLHKSLTSRWNQTAKD